MIHGSPWDLYVFRSPRRRVPTRVLLDGIAGDASGGRLADALVRAGELESALADCAAARASDTAAAPPHPSDRGPAAALHGAARAAAALTDEVARRAVGIDDGSLADALLAVRRYTEGADGPHDRVDALSVVPPEAFTYYALDPRDVDERLAAADLSDVTSAAVIGLRSIGTTLSAVACAAVRRRGGRADRITVRPTGPPYERRTRLTADQVDWLRARRDGHLIVLDEGPGVSGSSLLSAVDAAVDAGFPGDRIVVMCTRAPDASKLLARDAARRWAPLRVAVIPTHARLPSGFERLAPGGWRALFLGEQATARWPACWTWTERAKGISGDRARLVKFEGLGRAGAEARRRAEAVAAEGFGPPAADAGPGRLVYDVLAGRPCSPDDLDDTVVARLADYCAWRVATFGEAASEGRLKDMVAKNAEVLFGLSLDLRLETARPAVTDAHMMPHEWIRTTGAPLMKTDAASHGDDHVFPGPADIAWDLAGAVVEWRMPAGAIERLLDRYARRSGDDPRRRLGPWLLAYALHRSAWARFAAASLGPDDPESARLVAEADVYARWIRAAAAAGLLGDAGRLIARAEPVASSPAADAPRP